MAELIEEPIILDAAGSPPKKIEEFVGRAQGNAADVSIARMRSPQGWSEPGQKADFDEYTLVLAGTLHVRLRDAEVDVHAGQAVIVHRGEWVQYGTPGPEGAEYLAVCLPAFAPDAVHRDD